MNLTPHSIIPFELTDISGSLGAEEREHIVTKSSKLNENIKDWKIIINKRLKLVCGGETFRELKVLKNVMASLRKIGAQ